MEFEWDERKNRSNRIKHHVSFEEAVLIFDGPTLEKEDDRIDYGEDRLVALGVVNRQIVHVVYTRRGDVLRIISARRANKDERIAYRQAYP